MGASRDGVRVVRMTAPDAETAERVGMVVVDERLAACANVVSGVTSIYRWEGQIQKEAEVLVIVKTTVDVVGRLMERIAELHPYEVPELLALPAEVGAEKYLSWVRSEVGVSE